MELNKDNFTLKLKDILEHLTSADFVAIDFEFSGIKVKPARTVIEQMSSGNSGLEGKPTLQQRYEEVKAVAEKYTIFQAGITIGQQDKEKGGYVLRPYNVHLNPLVIHKMDIDREVTILSSAMTFLQKNRFDISKLFGDGVPYLSREEHRRAIQLESERLDGVNVGDIDFESLDAVSKMFLEEARVKIRTWRPIKKDETLIIYPPRGPKPVFEMLHRRLIHQLVRNEFPKVVATAQSNFVKILPFDYERETEHKGRKMDAFFARLSRQVGFRWLLEAITGGDLSDLSATDIYMDEHAEWIDLTEVNHQLADLRQRLKARRPVLVGHNPFTDLIYLYKTFIGPLPMRVKDFARKIHGLFPMIVDTKWLATHHGVVEASGLQQLAQEYEHQPAPEIYTDSRATHYQYTNASHEAGYDSYATAKLCILASARLAVRAPWREKVMAQIGKRRKIGEAGALVIRMDNGPAKADDLLIDLGSDDTADSTQTSNLRTLKEISYRHNAIFTPLDISRSRALETQPSDNLYSLLPKPVEPAQSDPTRWRLDSDGLPKWMPSWDSDFWWVFANKLRINGTVENMLDLLDP